MKDRTMGIISMLASFLLIFSLRGKGFETIAFPLALLIILIMLSLRLILRKAQKVYEFSKSKKVFMYFVTILVYILVLPNIGFIISTTCFLTSFIIINQYPMKKIMVIVFSLLVSLILWFIFSYLFGIAIPEILF